MIESRILCGHFLRHPPVDVGHTGGDPPDHRNVSSTGGCLLDPTRRIGQGVLKLGTVRNATLLV